MNSVDAERKSAAEVVRSAAGGTVAEVEFRGNRMGPARLREAAGSGVADVFG